MFEAISHFEKPDFIRLLVCDRGRTLYDFESEADLVARIQSDPALRRNLLRCTILEPALERAQHIARTVNARIAAVNACGDES
jgi:hypothetical protein